MFDKGMGRLFIHDGIRALDRRDLNYPMQAAIQEGIALPSYKHYRTGPTLDQGPYPFCVGYAWHQWLLSSPVRTKNGPAPFTIYDEAQDLDEWPGKNYAGTSVRGGAKAIYKRGHTQVYVWAHNARTIADFILSGHGGVVIGVNWYTGMLYPEPKTHLVKPTGAVEGGHAVFLPGYNEPRGLFTILNSWGLEYGNKGRAYITGEHLDRLLTEEGEACAALEQAVLIRLPSPLIPA